ncbi:preprotein translocase subunit SecA [Corynebacterium sp. MC-04]|mgnify:FL=1|uniref:Protein translocase subunit SecA n=1 Tax=Corynebacterium parakroppenstedtii TaxID=2828363 RepID=A0ABS9HJ63_9CORY|nr:preprotein translocase subunit SecA [Corynebacterium parakroppenstedtii]KXB50704.1 preprotein translocase, SecA subunit [Corynebacterium kroppenstedtii]MCZ9302515.1 preprotein translocase subunit SecA [Corynebacterium sp. c24U_166]MBY0792288.1 preprotein translocase subunit SecA [Corynebacterium parakroppenstedtii]MBY0793765.1 preprotein translocase subunit SecA [Corynebacterium parakroppenstedtii]MBY0795955.1 preprotein translocase subunit SecA [Corynebacterium parakroppenstedtii]
MLGLSSILRVGEGRAVKRLKNIADRVIALEDDYAALSDAELAAKTDEFKQRLKDGETVNDLLLEAFATAREASWRVLGQKHFPVQVMGAASLHFGSVAEMKTGEGKTLTCVLPAYLNALEGKGAHVVTVNDYLAKRDSEWMGRVHRFLGLKVDVILSGMTPEERRQAYNADITYGTNNEFGFDYLRDNMAHSLDELVQRGHHYAIVDEVDSILIDEARTPLIISGPAEGTSEWYTAFARIVPRMTRDIHYEVDERKRTVGIREEGVELVEDQLGIDNLYAPQNSQLVGYLNNAIKAKELFVRDKDYIVRNGEVLIVDEFTGRVLSGRRYNEGMHQAIEAKEGVEIQAENQTLATITLQNYFRLYDKLAGMTGTAETEASELHQIYKLDVNQIPTNRPNQRIDKSDLVYKTQEAKFRAVADDIEERVQKGQPVLVGTTSVERSEYLSHLLQSKGVRHSVLNAKHHEEEAQVVAQAGRLGAVTVATNMAGRGTDIVLGGNPDIIADINLRQRGLDPVETPEEYEQAWDEEIARVRDASKKEAKEVCEAGGLYVLGTERHESRRIDNQLRGRCARQGDPGETRFYLSMRDELMTRFVGPSMEAMMNRLNVPDDVPIEAKMVTNAIKSAQTQVESQNFEMRKNVLKYDEVMNSQRKVIYAERRQILEGLDLRDQVRAMIDDTISAYVYAETADGYVEDWDLGALWNALESLYGPTMSWQSLIDSSEYGPAGELPVEDLRRALIDDALAQYEDLEKVVEAIGGDEQMRNLERYTLLNVVDQKWREHLYEMDYLKEGIGLRAMAQRDPLVEYQREGGDMFRKMEDGIKEEAVRQLFMVRQQIEANKMQQNADVNGDGEVDATDFAGERQEVQMSYSGPDETGSASAVNEGDAEAQPKNRRERRAAARAQRKSGRHAR